MDDVWKHFEEVVLPEIQQRQMKKLSLMEMEKIAHTWVYWCILKRQRPSSEIVLNKMVFQRYVQ